MLRKGIAALLCGPGCGGMLGDGHVNDSSTVVREDDEYEKQPERDRWQDEEVRGYDLARVIRQKRAPRLGRGRRCLPMYLATVDWLAQSKLHCDSLV
jgi:hypothetical protein